MAGIDWAIIGLYLVIVTVIGLLFLKKASGSVAEYFVAGRNLPWWLAGTSLVATSFAADTPLAVTGFIAKNGIAGNWIWWNQVVVWVLAIVFFARLWRRSNLLTDAEFIEIRYAGPAAAFLRGFKAFYSAVIFSTATLAWVMLAMQKIVAATVPAPDVVLEWETHLEAALGFAPDSIDLWKWIVLITLFVVATFYTVISGYWGIVVTDLFQLIVALVASTLFAVLALNAVGGMEELKLKLAERFTADGVQEMLRFFPRSDSTWMPLSTFIVYLSVLWWGDCGGFAAQRMFSTRSDRDATLTALWYSIAHFAIRPWPWIIVALVTLVYYPHLEDVESGYPMLMMEILPAGLRGLMVASLLAAFMSTVDTHLNWNASYFVNDVYLRFIRPKATEKQSVNMSRLSTIVFAAMAIVLAYFMNNIGDAWVFLFNLQAGIGMVQMLRWFWWRVNVWTEISAMIASLIVTPGMRWVDATYGLELSTASLILATVIFTTIVWVTVTFLTKPTEPERLESFYRRVRPPGVWKKVAQCCPEMPAAPFPWLTIVRWLIGVVALYAIMFGIGRYLLGDPLPGLLMLGGGVACGIIAIRLPERSPAAQEA